MNPRLRALHQKMEALTNRAAELSAKEDWTDQDRSDAEGLQGQIAQVQADIERTQSLSGLAASTNEYLNGNGALSSLAGLTNAEIPEDQQHLVAREIARDRGIGERTAFVDRAGTELMARTENGRFVSVDSEGWGISEKQARAICEPRYAKALDRMLRGKADRADYVSLSEGADSGGGYLVPPEWLAQVIMRRPHPTSLLAHVNQVPCSRDKLIFPRVNYDGDTGDIFTSGVRIQWVGEQGPTPSVTEPTFGDVEIPIYTGQFPIEVSRNLLEDAAVPVGTIIQTLAAQAYNLGMDNVVVNGTGINQPTGFMINPGGTGLQPPTYNLGDPITADGLTQLVYGLPPQYADDDQQTVAVMNRMSAFSKFAQIKDGSGQYIFGLARTEGPEGMANARKPVLFGYNTVFSAFMPNVATNAYPVAFGDFKELYVLARRIGLAVQPYGDQDKSMLAANKVGWFFRFRAGGQVVQNRAVHIGKQA